MEGLLRVRIQREIVISNFVDVTNTDDSAMNALLQHNVIVKYVVEDTA